MEGAKRMKFSKGQVLSLVIAIVIAFFLSTYELPFYIQKPGGADALNPIVQVDHGDKGEGDFHLVTVRGGQATPIQYVLAKILPHHDIVPISQVFPEGISDDEYFQAQLQMMETSQEASTVVAYTAADKDITIDYNGVYVVSVVEGMPAEGILAMGDRIIGIDSTEIHESDDLITYINSKKAGDTVNLTIVRDDEELEKSITLETFAEAENNIGIGIQLVTDREVEVSPEITFTSGSIGGPSAGLMFSLEIYDQLTDGDLTKGHQIAGTGEIDYDGKVHRIGGIDKKIVAADREGIEVFFAPNEDGRKNSNYQEAMKKAKEIGTEMVIVPVDTFDDALRYLEEELD